MTEDSQQLGKKLGETGAGGRKLQIDQTLIKSASSSLPDELKELGVCAYNENDFQKGVLYQVDVQLAQFDLEQAATTRKKRSSRDGDDDQDEEAAAYEQKKARLESTIETYSSYLNEPDGEASNDSDMRADSASASALVTPQEDDTERMIKMGEMTPFGGKIV